VNKLSALLLEVIDLEAVLDWREIRWTQNDEDGD
jgi:hypothetical protein